MEQEVFPGNQLYMYTGIDKQLTQPKKHIKTNPDQIKWPTRKNTQKKP